MNVVFEVLTSVVMKSFIFWDITPCSLLKVNRRFGGTCHLHLQGLRVSRMKQAARKAARFLVRLPFNPEDGGDMFLRNVD
jgi:hypothetical protein